MVVAPHGGRRVRERRWGYGVNDLHTADIARELAAALDAHAVVNAGLDRNEADLNRISDLVSRAPEFLGALGDAVSEAGGGGDIPLVVFVHGWNMVVPCCDVGAGLAMRGGTLAGRYPTLSRARYDAVVGALESEFCERGLTVGVGRRYAATGRDNATQLFSGRHADHDDEGVAALGRLAAAGGVDAVQLELGIPLRWPGAKRDACIDALVAALGSLPTLRDAVARDEWQLEPIRKAAGRVRARPSSVQAVLGPNLALFAGVEATAPHSLAARFCVVDTRGPMALLVGEGPWGGEAGSFDLEGLRWRAGDRTIDLAVGGDAVLYPDHDAYLDLERGLAASRVIEVRGELSVAFDDDGLGVIEGELTLDGERYPVAGPAFADGAGRFDEMAPDRVRLFVAAGGRGAAKLRSTDDGGPRPRWMDPAGDASGHGVSGERPDGGSDASPNIAIEPPVLGTAGARVVAEVPVWREGPGSVRIRWSFGVARSLPGSHERQADELLLFDRLKILER